MKAVKLQIRGTEMNKIAFAEIEPYLEEKGMNVDAIFSTIADSSEFVYVSNGFVRGLKASENNEGEWHHYFKKDTDGTFSAGKLKFN